MNHVTNAGSRQRLPGTPKAMHYWPGSEGVMIAGDAWGNPAHPLVIMLHGGGQTRHAWKGTGALLGAAGCFAVALDARGHGDSGWSAEGDYSTDAMVRDLCSVVAALGGRKPVLIGASMGGICSLVAAGEKHVDASAVILVDVVPRCEVEGVERVKAFMRQSPDGFSCVEEAADAISRYRAQRTRPASLKGLAKNLRLSADGRYHWHWDPRFLSRPAESIGRYERLSACARRLQMPVLLARGADSDVVTDQGAQDFLELCPHAQDLSIAKASHMVAGDQNDAFGNAASEFLLRHLV